MLIDGYNVLQKMPELSVLKLEDGRRGLVRFVETTRPQGSARNSITIVFDGREDVWGSESSPEVRVLFSRGESADELIKRMVSTEKSAAQTVLVTDDRDLGYYCRTHGACWWSVADFFQQARKNGAALKSGSSVQSRITGGSAGRRSHGRPVDEKKISERAAHMITSELSRVWLDKKG